MLLPWATLIYIDLGTYNSLVRSNSSHSAKEFGAQNSQGDLLYERKRLKDKIRFFSCGYCWINIFNLQLWQMNINLTGAL